jgi:ABC-type Mn2+/Zn2+ transport system ATPase subunit
MPAGDSPTDSRPLALECAGLSIGYNGALAVQDVSLAVASGERVGVLGPNGAGKSTLFKAIAGLLPVRAGRLLVRGRAVGEAGAEVAYVPQREEVDWHFPVTVADVVMMGRYGRLGPLRWPGRADRAAVAAALEQLGLAGQASKPIAELSGGQQQRVFLARALAQEVDLLLLDEPFTAVDAATEAAVLALLDELTARGATVVTATHDLNRAQRSFDRLLFLNRRLIAYGPPAEVFTPEVLRATFGEQLTMWSAGGRVVAVTDPHHHGDH